MLKGKTEARERTVFNKISWHKIGETKRGQDLQRGSPKPQLKAEVRVTGGHWKGAMDKMTGTRGKEAQRFSSLCNTT